MRISYCFVYVVRSITESFQVLVVKFVPTDFMETRLECQREKFSSARLATASETPTLTLLEIAIERLENV